MKLAAALVLACCLPSFAIVRMAIIIGNNIGLADDKPLQYATRDAEQVDAVMVQLGGIDKGKGYLLLDPDVSKVMMVFQDARRKIIAMRNDGQKVQLLIYYSGHGSDEALHMNGEKLPLSRIRDYFHDIEADLKILIADACFSGSLIQAKGANLAEPVPVKYRDELKVNGSAILTSSSAGELSQESKELQGSLFTHYFLTAIRGAGDADKDGSVSLWEAYNYTQANLRRKLASAKNVAQNPEFDMDLHGSENVVLTRVALGQAFLSLKGIPEGRYQILEAVNALQIAEVNISDPDGVTLALPKAPYLVFRSNGQKGEAGFADLRRSKTVELGPNDFNQVAIGDLSAKGMLGPRRLELEDRGPVQVSLQPRLYSSFPGRAGSAIGIDASIQGNWNSWGASLAFDYLPAYRTQSKGISLAQQGIGFAGEARYYWGYSPLGVPHLGPRVEMWSLDQTVNGTTLNRGNLLGTFGVFGLEKNLGYSFSFGVGAGAGYFWSYDGAGRLRRDPSFPFSVTLRFGT